MKYVDNKTISKIVQLDVGGETKFLVYNYRNGDWMKFPGITVLVEQVSHYLDGDFPDKAQVHQTALHNRRMQENKIDNHWKALLGQFFIFNRLYFPFEIEGKEDFIERSNYLIENSTLQACNRVELFDRRTNKQHTRIETIYPILRSFNLMLEDVYQTLRSDRQKLNDYLLVRYQSDNRHWLI